MLQQHIEIKPSLSLAVALCVAHAAAAGAVWFSALPPPLHYLLLAAIGAALTWSLVSQAALRRSEAIVALEIAASGRIAFLTRGGSWHACALLGTSYVSPRLTILNVRTAGSRWPRHLVIVPDNVDADDFRRLRTWLRWAAKLEPASSDGPSAFS